MSLETFALAENVSKASQIQGISPYEKFKTRLVRINLPPYENFRDPIQHYVRKGFRRSWYYLNRAKLAGNEPDLLERRATLMPPMERTWGNTVRVVEILTRFVIALVAGTALVCPMAILFAQLSANARLVVVVVCSIIFCFVVSALSKATNYEAMAASAAYAAVLTVFLSNSPGS